MATERHIEHFVLQEMRATLGENAWGCVYDQGDVGKGHGVDALLKKAGGKPKDCPLGDFLAGGAGKAKPEHIVTFNDDAHTIIVVECKRSTSKHESKDHAQPRDYAVDGVLYYAKYLKEKYNVIAVAASGTPPKSMRVSTFYWMRGQDAPQELVKARDSILEPKNYIKLIKGEKLQKMFSLADIRETALDMHDTLRSVAMNEKYKPIFIAGILIALENADFVKDYASSPSFSSLMDKLKAAITRALQQSDVKRDKIDNIQSILQTIENMPKFRKIALDVKGSLAWYVEQLELKIRPMMDHADSTLDALGVFYHEFVKYSGGDGKGLGIVLTPQHLTEFMVEATGISKNDRVADICCGTGSFLVAAMQRMCQQATQAEITKVKEAGLYGVELDVDLHTLAIANMIIRRDGKSNVLHGNCFDKKIVGWLVERNLTKGLINPPYSQEEAELQFLEQLLEVLVSGGTAGIVCPMSCAIGTKFKEIRRRLFSKHTLRAVFSMPDDIFASENAGTNVCVMIWEAHKSHDSTKPTFFGYYKEDGFVKAKKLGRIDKFEKWQTIKNEWLHLYEERVVKPGLSAKQCVTHEDEWLCEAYMETDYSQLTQDDFQQTVNNYLAYLVKGGYRES